MSDATLQSSPAATPMRAAAGGCVPAVVIQHADEVAALRQIRSVLVRAPQVSLRDLRRLDDRIAAHVDALSIAGRFATACCTRALERPTTGPVFAAAVHAIHGQDTAALERLLAVAAALPALVPALVSAFGWVSAQRLRGLVHPLLDTADPVRMAIGLAACRLHQVDPGEPLHAALKHKSVLVRVQALRVVATLGRVDCGDHAQAALADPALALDAACALCLLGQPAEALPVLQALALGESPVPEATRTAALVPLMLSLPFEPALALVRSSAAATRGRRARERTVLRAFGLLGDVQFVPWLIARMDETRHARAAGEAFAWITGADLAELGLERSKEPPRRVRDAAATLDPQEGLPWPDREAVQRWWAEHAPAFSPGRRHFMGAPPSADHCEHILRSRPQRQRAIAAQQACMLRPGLRLFNTQAPAWRQQRLLEMPA